MPSLRTVFIIVILTYPRAHSIFSYLDGGVDGVADAQQQEGVWPGEETLGAPQRSLAPLVRQPAAGIWLVKTHPSGYEEPIRSYFLKFMY
jgi:hypothetical protein